MSERELLAIMAAIIWSGPRAQEANLDYEQATRAAYYLFQKTESSELVKIIAHEH